MGFSTGVAYGTPVMGTWWDNTTDPSSTLQLGTWSESFVGGGPGQPGNVLEASSSNDQWSVSDLTLASVVFSGVHGGPITLPSDIVVDTPYFRRYVTVYTEGAITVTNGPWIDDGDTAYTASSVTAIVYSNHYLTDHPDHGGLVTGERSSTLFLEGTFDQHPEYNVVFMGRLWDVPAFDANGYFGPVTKSLLYIVPEPVAITSFFMAGAFVLVMRRLR